MAQRDRVDLQAALRSSVVPLSVKALKKKGVRRVKVIERERLLKALVQAVEQKLADRPLAQGASEASPTEKKRVELLLVELERVAKAKTQLEHEKGLLEAERSRLSAELDKIAQEVSKGTGHKVKPEEVRNLLDELERVRDDRDKARKALDRALKEAEHRIDSEVTRACKAEDEVAELKSQLTALLQAHDALTQDRDALAVRAARLEETEAEAARLSGERDKLAEKNLTLQRDCARYEASYESALQEVAAAAPIVAAWKEAEAAKAAAAEADKAAAEKAGKHDMTASKTAETTPRFSPTGTRHNRPATGRRAVPGFGFGDAATAPRETQPRGDLSSFGRAD
jgi:chromosome segregation ATPase